MDSFLEELNNICPSTLMESLGIEFIEVTNEYLRAKMPIDNRTCRPDGRLHGGANLVLAETLGGAFGYIALPKEQRFNIFGIEVNGNHIKQAKGNYVIGEARFIHIGRSTQVIDVKIFDEYGTLVTISRVTNMVVR